MYSLPLIRIGVFHGWSGEGAERQWPRQPPPDFANIRFHFSGYRELDYVFVLNDVQDSTWVKCDPARIWGFIQEPPTELHTHLHDGRPYFARVFTTDERRLGPRHEQFWSALKWATGLSYDELRAQPYPHKVSDLSWVTSNLALLPGHQKRMSFLSSLRREMPELKLYGRGFSPIARKWDALAPSRYSIAFENFSDGTYWSEKLADCFLSYATPIYYGARDIDRYFPKGSYITFDPDARGAIERVREIVSSDFHEQNLDALLEARELCLTKYNTLFYLARLAQSHTTISGPTRNFEWQRLTPAHSDTRWKRGLRRLRELTIRVFPPAVTQRLRSIKHGLQRATGRRRP